MVFLYLAAKELTGVHVITGCNKYFGASIYDRYINELMMSSFRLRIIDT